jgi:hypothetical protein
MTQNIPPSASRFVSLTPIFPNIFLNVPVLALHFPCIIFLGSVEFWLVVFPILGLLDT